MPMNKKNVLCHDKSFVPYLEHGHIQKRCIELANVLNAHYRGRTPVFLVVLNGAFMFASELIRHYQGNCEVSFVKLSSYQGTESTGIVKELIGLQESLEGRDVIIVEDIVDTGYTITSIMSQVRAQGATTVEVATLLFKPQSLRVGVLPRYIGFDVPNMFYLGFGLDYKNLGRNLPHIYREQTTSEL